MGTPRAVQTPAYMLEKAVSALNRGGLVAFPTDTLYALGAHAFMEEAIEQGVRGEGQAPGYGASPAPQRSRGNRQGGSGCSPGSLGSSGAVLARGRHDGSLQSALGFVYNYGREGYRRSESAESPSGLWR